MVLPKLSNSRIRVKGFSFRAWLACRGDHRRLQHTKYLLQNLQTANIR